MIVVFGLIAIIGILSYLVHRLDRYGKKNKFEALIWNICYKARMFFLLIFPCAFGLFFVVNLSEAMKIYIENVEIVKMIFVLLLGMLCVTCAMDRMGLYPSMGAIIYVFIVVISLELVEYYYIA
jgi:hypothetical protein